MTQPAPVSINHQQNGPLPPTTGSHLLSVGQKMKEPGVGEEEEGKDTHMQALLFTGPLDEPPAPGMG